MRAPVRAALGALSATLVLTACGATADEPEPSRAAAPSASPPTQAAPSRSPSDDGVERVQAVLDGVELSLEVADDPDERALGLMRRTEVPPGTGMVFRYDEPSKGRFWMYDVPVPLRAVFVRDGRVVSSVLMPPCEEPVASDCATYGASGAYDTVVETSPETLPDVQPGDAFELRG